MPRLTRLYTRKGDEGMTSLGSRERVQKESLRVAAYGTVDELNAHLGLALSSGLSERLAQFLPIIQNELFHLGSDLAFPEDEKTRYQIPRIEDRHVTRLEELVDDLVEIVGPLENFILPGGTAGASHLHVARTVCRRAERVTAALSRSEPIGSQVLPYLNRLSDALFVMSRYENHSRGVAEPLWDALK